MDGNIAQRGETGVGEKMLRSKRDHLVLSQADRRTEKGGTQTTKTGSHEV